MLIRSWIVQRVAWVDQVDSKLHKCMVPFLLPFSKTTFFHLLFAFTRPSTFENENVLLHILSYKESLRRSVISSLNLLKSQLSLTWLFFRGPPFVPHSVLSIFFRKPKNYVILDTCTGKRGGQRNPLIRPQTSSERMTMATCKLFGLDEISFFAIHRRKRS